MRIAVVGAGPWARETHIPALSAHPGVDLTGVWTRRPEAAGGIGLPRYPGFDALLDDVDAVSFAIPPSAQPPLAIRAARAGRHVILDKPIAADLDAATDLAQAVSDAGVISVVTFTRRFAPETRAFLDAARAGRYRGGIARWLSGALLGGRYASSPWRADHGALLDVGPHVIDLLDAALGDIVDVLDARVIRQQDIWQIGFAHASGASSTAQMSLRVPARPTVTEFAVHGPDGVVSLTERSTSSVDCFTTLVDEFLDAQATRRPHPLDVQRGLHVQQIVDSVLRAL